MANETEAKIPEKVEVLGVQVATKESRSTEIRLTGLIHVWDCPYCGQRIQEQFKVCPNCGAEWSGLQSPGLANRDSDADPMPTGQAVKTVVQSVPVPPYMSALLIDQDAEALATADAMLAGDIPSMAAIAECVTTLDKRAEDIDKDRENLSKKTEKLDQRVIATNNLKADLDKRERALKAKEKAASKPGKKASGKSK